MKTLFFRFLGSVGFAIGFCLAFVQGVILLLVGRLDSVELDLENKRLRLEVEQIRKRNAELRGELAGYHRLESEMRLQLTALKKRLGEQDGADWWKS